MDEGENKNIKNSLNSLYNAFRKAEVDFPDDAERHKKQNEILREIYRLAINQERFLANEPLIKRSFIENGERWMGDDHVENETKNVIHEFLEKARAGGRRRRHKKTRKMKKRKASTRRRRGSY